MTMSKSQAAATRDMKHRVLTCLNKLSDRDTYSAAAAELESIAKSLSHDSIPPFLSSIAATDSSDKSPVRKQCLRLISLLSESHGDALSPYLSKLLTAIVRRIRDPDSAVRSACINATASISLHITKPPFASVVKPLVEALFTEQDQNAQIGAAMCLAEAIDRSPEPDLLYLKKLIPRMEKLLKCDNFKAKPALLTLFGSVIGAGVASTQLILKNLLPCLVEFIGSEDWAARRAAAEALVKLALEERDMLPEFKAACLKTFEAKKFDKVKIVRETMNQLVNTWKGIPDISDDLSPPLELEPQSSSRENASDGRYPPGSRNSCTVTSGAPQVKKKSIAASVSSTGHKRSPIDGDDKKSGPAMFRKLDRKKPIDWKVDSATSHELSISVPSEDAPRRRDVERAENVPRRFRKQETKRALFNQNENSKSTVVVSNVTEDIHRSQKESEDLALIHKQLGHIENQQSNLLDLLQKFIGSSQTGMRFLETRVHGLELALDEISYDLIVSTKTMSNSDSEGTSCCKLPGAEFLSPKFWRKTEPRHSTSHFSSSGAMSSNAAMRERTKKNANVDAFSLEDRRLRLQGRSGFIVNPLAHIQSDSHGILEVSSSRVIKNVQDAM